MRILISDIINKVGKAVEIAGWVDTRRDHGKLIFIDLRDQSGTVQIIFSPENKALLKEADQLRSEWVVAIKGKVKERPSGMVNHEISTGLIEIEATKLTVLSQAETAPIDVSGDGYDISEEHRLTWRYLDLRRGRLQKNIRMRHRVVKFIRDYLDKHNFIEIETPILTKSTPEGARDYVVPSRLNPGQFYALPQSPQQYKQLLMASGFERYFQIARCFRDEDTRGDRQPEFTQLDIEMSFVERDDVLNLIEELTVALVESVYPEKTILKKPFEKIPYQEAIEKYKSDRPDLRKNKDDPNELAFAFIVDFPLFEGKGNGGNWEPSHHMFTAPVKEDIEKLEADPTSVRSYQYDLVLNGAEIAGGSIRIHDPRVQEKIFELIGFREDQKKEFKHMLTAFKHGIPPHGGIALGLDRLVAILQGEETIREVIAFPKTGEGRDLMMDAPSGVDPSQLRELHIKIETDEKN